MERDAILTSNRTEAPAGHSPEVSVVVPHFHDLVGLALCLSSLHAQSWPRERFEIIVADNDSPEGQEAVEGVIAGRARLVLVKERGAGPARNGGAAAAGGEILAFTDSDCRADPRWLETGTAALASYDIVGGAMQVLTEDPRCLSPVESYERIFAFNNRRYIRRKGFTVTANLFCSRRVFESIGDFSSDVVSEDVEWCDRARRLGYRIGYAEAAVVSHPARRNWQELVVKWRRLNQESFGLMSRRRGGRWLWVARSLALPLSSFIHTPLALLSPRAPRLDQRLSAAGVLHRLRWWRLRDSLGLLLSPPNHPAGRANSQVGARPTKADPGDPPGAKLLPPVAPRRRASVSLPLVSVIIPHFGDLAGLALCLDALEAQTWPADRVEIIVADNASPEGLPAVERVVAGRARLVLIEERGAGPARNGAVAASTGDILAFIDSDCIAEPEWIERGLEGLAGYDFIGGRVRVLVADRRRLTSAEAFERVFAFDFEDFILRKGFTGSGNLFCGRSVFERVGGFRAGVAEDVDWSFRARAAGFRLGYIPAAVVGHPARRTWPALRAKWRKTDSEGFGLYRERRYGRWIWVLRSLCMPASALVHAPKVLASPQLETTGQRFSALWMLARIRLWRCADCLRLATRSRA